MFLLEVINSLSVLYSVIETSWCGLVTILRMVNNTVSVSGFILSALLSMTVKPVTKHFLSELCWHADVKRGVISHRRKAGGRGWVRGRWVCHVWTNAGGLLPPLSSDGCVCRELKVATGEWFLEERSKRFEQGLPSSDVIKQTIMSTPCCEFGARSQSLP